MMLGKADRVIAEFVGQLDLLGQFPQHALIEVRPHTGHPGLDLGAAANAGQIKQRRLHAVLRQISWDEIKSGLT